VARPRRKEVSVPERHRSRREAHRGLSPRLPRLARCCLGRCGGSRRVTKLDAAAARSPPMKVIDGI
jgi:hypothetical protein